MHPAPGPALGARPGSFGQFPPAAAAHSRAATDAMHNLAGTFVDWARRNPHSPADDSKIVPGGWVPKPLYTGAGLIPPRNMVSVTKYQRTQFR